MMTLDRYDLKILSILQTNADISNMDLADQIGLSASPCLRRVKQLEEAGYINRRVAILNPKHLGLTLMAYVLVGMDKHTPERFAHFESQIKNWEEILECSLITGMDADYQLKVFVADMAAYQNFLLGKLTRVDGVNSVRSSFVLNQVVNTTSLPLPIPL